MTLRGTPSPELLGLRPQVYAFALLMEHKLQMNDAVKPYWKNSGLSIIHAHLVAEMKELHAELHADRPNARLVALEAADIGCLAMMVADCIGGLQLKEIGDGRIEGALAPASKTDSSCSKASGT